MNIIYHKKIYIYIKNNKKIFITKTTTKVYYTKTTKSSMQQYDKMTNCI